jgi:hypothetical protein
MLELSTWVMPQWWRSAVAAAALEEAKNKPKASAVVASSSTPAKRHRCRPLGNKNKPKISATSAVDDLDISLAQPPLSQSSAGVCSPFLLLLVPNALNSSVAL